MKLAKTVRRNTERKITIEVNDSMYPSRSWFYPTVGGKPNAPPLSRLGCGSSKWEGSPSLATFIHPLLPFSNSVGSRPGPITDLKPTSNQLLSSNGGHRTGQNDQSLLIFDGGGLAIQVRRQRLQASKMSSALGL
jgi:hypothetical protein